MYVLQAIEKESEDGIKESCCSLAESLDLLTQQTGSLTLARCVLDHALNQVVEDKNTDLTINHEFLTQQVNNDFILQSSSCLIKPDCVCVSVCFSYAAIPEGFQFILPRLL